MAASQSIQTGHVSRQSIEALHRLSKKLLLQASEQALALLQSIWDAVRRMVDAIFRLLGLKRSSPAAQAVDTPATLDAAAAAASKGLAAAEAAAGADQLSQALQACQFNAFEQSLIRGLSEPHAYDSQTAARLLEPVFRSSAQRLSELDLRIQRQRLDLAALAAPLTTVFGGFPLLVDDVLRLCRTVSTGRMPAGVDVAQISQLLRMDDEIRASLASRERVVAVIANFAGRSMREGVDLSPVQGSLELALGADWLGRIKNEPVSSLGAQAKANLTSGQPMKASDRLRALMAAEEAEALKNNDIDEGREATSPAPMERIAA